MRRQYLGREGAYLKGRYFVRQFSTSVKYLVIDPLHIIIRVVQNGFAGEQHERCNGRRQTKEITILNGASSLFVLFQCVACSPKCRFFTTRVTSCKRPIIK